MKKIKVLLLFLLMLVPTLLASCGSSDYYREQHAGSNESVENNVSVDTTRKIYYTVDYTIVSSKVEEIKSDVNGIVKSYNGYIDESTDNDGYGYYTYRIPTQYLNEFLDEIDSLGDDVSSKSISSNDVTISYSELEARKEVLNASRAAYMNLLSDPDITMSELIALTDKINEIDTELLSIEKQLGYYDNLIDYSTVHITYRTTIEDEGFMSEYGEYLLNVFKGIGIAILYTLPFGVIGLGIFGIVILIIKGKRKNNKNVEE